MLSQSTCRCSPGNEVQTARWSSGDLCTSALHWLCGLLVVVGRGVHWGITLSSLVAGKSSVCRNAERWLGRRALVAGKRR